MKLVDTDVISEVRKEEKANPGVRRFFADADRDNVPLYLSVVTVGEQRQSVESIRHRGDEAQARVLALSAKFAGGSAKSCADFL